MKTFDKRTQNYLPVYIYNSVEDEWGYIGGLKNKSDQIKRITLSNAYADSYLFANSGRPEFIFISPVFIPEGFRSYFEKLTGSKVTILNPTSTQPFICRAFMEDKRNFARLLELSKKYKGLSLYPYASTPQVYELQQALIDKGVRVTLPHSPEKSSLWTVATFGSKNGFRELVKTLTPKYPFIQMPQGAIYDSLKEALDQAYITLEDKGAALMKISKGSGGHGTYILKKNNSLHTRTRIEKKLQNDPLWSQNKIVVEEFVKTTSRQVAFPSIECLVEGKTKYSILYHCRMLVTKEGNFYGMEVGNEAVPLSLQGKMNRIGRLIAQTYATNGYRGHFDIDMIYDRQHKLYVDESNIRNTGGTDAYKLAVFLLGTKLFKHSFILSKFVDFPNTTPLPDFEEIQKSLTPILYSPLTKTGLIISSQSSLKENSVTYFIIARTKRGAYSIEKKLLKLIHSLT